MNETQQYQHYSANAEPQPPATARPQFWKYTLTALVAAFLTFCLTAFGGFMLYVFLSEQGIINADRQTSNNISFAADEDTVEAVQKLRTVLKLLGDNYYEKLTDAQLLEAMTSGLVDEIGSRYTMYLTKEQNDQLNSSMSGEYVGIGALVTINKNGMAEITEILADSPAQEAGIHAGDVFVQVNETDVTAIDAIEEVAIIVKGEAGTDVKLVMYRASEGRNIEFTVTRRKITNAALSYKMLDNGLGYVQIRDFSQGVARQFEAAVKDLTAQGAEHIVFDMRNNSGGRADEVIEMLDFLLPKSTIATVRGRSNGKEFSETWDSDASMGVPDTMRYALLINGNTASAAELFSGCLRDNGKGYLIGEQSFGKGSGTQTYQLDDGSAINVTIFLYYLPNGESIEEIGLEPDLEVELPAEVAGLSISQLTIEQDTQLAAAIQYLTNLD
jgi:carboxyl-terminal processing protease